MYIDWDSEPGGTRIEIKEIVNQQHLVILSAGYYTDEFSINDSLLDYEFSIPVQKKQLILLFYFEFKKIDELMKNCHFAKERKTDFPIAQWKKFEKSAKVFFCN